MPPIAGTGPRALVNLFADETVEPGFVVGVFCLDNQAEEPSVPVDEVVLVPETPRPQGHAGGHRDPGVVANALKDDRPLEHRVGLIPDRDVLNPELVLAGRPDYGSQLAKPLLEDTEI